MVSRVIEQADLKTAGLGTDWISSETKYDLSWPVTGAVTATLAQNGQIALTGASRASDLSSNYGSLQTTIPFAGFAFNDDTGRHVTVYAGYSEAQTLPGSSGLAFGHEIDAANRSGTVPTLPPTPGTPLQYGGTYALWLASGGDHSDAKDAQFAVGIKDNGAAFQAGIVFGANALTMSGGFGYAMKLAKGHIIQWFDGSDSVGPFIVSTVASAANAMSLQFQDGGTLFLNPGGTAIGFEVQSQVGAVNGLQVQPVVSGTSPQIMAQGTDTNIGINLVPKGTGAVYTPALLSAASVYAASAISTPGSLTVNGATQLAALAATGTVELGASDSKLGFYGGGGAMKPTVSGSRAGNAALASLITALASLGLITDSSTT